MNNAEILEAIIDTRSLSLRDAGLRDKFESGELVKIGPRAWAPADWFNSLAWYEKRHARAVGHGIGVTQAVLMGRSAARVVGMWTVPLTDETVELALVRGNPSSRSRWPRGVTYYRNVLVERYIWDCERFRATSMVRTATDIARVHGFEEGLIAFDWLLGRASREAVERELAAMGQLSGICTAREALRCASNKSESAFESLCRARLLSAGFEDVEMQVNLLPGIRVDLKIGRVVIEVDGEEKYWGTYGKDVEQVLREEREREKAIQNAGYRVLRYKPRVLLKDPEKMIREVKQALELDARVVT